MWTALIVVVFLQNGEPQIYAKMLSPGVTCDYAAALALVTESTRGFQVQDLTLWDCKNVESPGPARPALFQGQTEAAK